MKINDLKQNAESVVLIPVSRTMHEGLRQTRFICLMLVRDLFDFFF